MLCLEDKNDHIFIHLVESANFKKGTNKLYLGEAGNLFAFACKLSFEKGYEGYIAFDSKSALIENYRIKLTSKQHFGILYPVDSNVTTNFPNSNPTNYRACST